MRSPSSSSPRRLARVPRLDLISKSAVDYNGRTKTLPRVTSERARSEHLSSKRDVLAIDSASYPKIAAWARARLGEAASSGAVPRFSGGTGGGGGLGGGGGGTGGGGGYYDEIDG